MTVVSWLVPRKQVFNDNMGRCFQRHFASINLSYVLPSLYPKLCCSFRQKVPEHAADSYTTLERKEKMKLESLSRNRILNLSSFRWNIRSGDLNHLRNLDLIVMKTGVILSKMYEVYDDGSWWSLSILDCSSSPQHLLWLEGVKEKKESR